MSRCRTTIAVILSSTVLLIAHSIDAESGPLAPTGLMCELLTAPETTVITDPSPRFGWIVNSDRKDDVQKAYQILVCSSRELEEKDTGDVWDSGQVKSGQSTSVLYGGKPLQSNACYYWKVRTWNTKGHVSGYSRAQEFRTGELSNQYTTPRLPLVREEISPVRVVEVAGGHVFIDFGRAAFGTVKLTLTSPSAGRKVEVHLGEVVAGGAAINRSPGEHRRYCKVDLPLDEGTHTYTVRLPRDRRNTTGAAVRLPAEIGVIMPFRYCEVVGAPCTLNPSQVRQLAVHTPFNDAASDFKSSSQVLNDVWELCKYSMKATSFCGVYVDGDRERIPYEADAYINQLGHYCVDREYAMGRHTDEYLITHPTWPTEWIIHSVLLAWADYQYTGDPRSLAHFYKDLQAKTLSALAREDGLISTQTGLLTKAVLESVHFQGKMRDIVDWPHGNQGGVNARFGETDGYEFLPINTVVNAFHLRSLALMARIAEVLGKKEDARTYADRFGRVLQEFNRKLFDKTKGIYVDGEGSRHSSLHANMFPLAFGLVPEPYAKGVADFVAGRGMACSVYGSQYLLESLYSAGRAEPALKLLTARDDRSWFNMIKVGSTITLEAWDNKYKPEQDWNHAWGAAPANIIPRLLMGVEPIEPGFSKIRIRPQPASLEWARLKLPTIKGTVWVDFRQGPGRFFALNVNIPANTTAVVYLPRWGNGRMPVTMDGEKKEAVPEGQFLRLDEVGSGGHMLQVRMDAP
jgi:alpha-L-rhamnosidase